MENKRAGFSFKAVGVVGFVLLTFLLIRLLRLPEGAVPSEVLPNFLMLLLGVLVLGSSFILLALGRLVELLQGFRSTQALLTEIRDETERVRIESQYIYEVQKDTLVKLTNINDAALNKAVGVVTEDKQPNNPFLTQTPSNAANSANTVHSENEVSKVKTSTSSATISRGASFAASRLSKNIDQGKITPQSTEQAKASTFNSDIQANTDESTWSSLVDQNETDIQSGQLGQSKHSEEDLISDGHVVDLQVSDADYDRAGLDGSDDIVDAIPQPKTWKPLADDELVDEEVSVDSATKLDRQDVVFADSSIKGKVTEVSDAEIGESLDAAVVDLKSDNLERKWSEKEKPVFEDRLSQTEKITEKNKISPDNAVRFGSFPEVNKVGDIVDDAKSSFTLQDIAEEDFGEANLDASGIVRSSNLNRESDFLQKSESDSLEEVFSTAKNSSETSDSGYREEQSFLPKGFSTTEDSFETAEDSFDDIREVFDTQAKKLASDVKDMTGTPAAQDRIKDSLKRASDKVARETSDLGKNLN